MFLDKLFGKKKQHGSQKKRRASRSGSTRAQAAALEQFVVEEIEVGAVAQLDETAPRPASRSRKHARAAFRMLGVWGGLWLLLLGATLFGRGPWPLDETRNLALAWWQWTQGVSLTLQLNGQVDTSHAPLMAWLTAVAWRFTGPVEWAARLLPALFTLATLFMTHALARALWPGRVDVARYAPLILVGVASWALYTTLLLPDVVLVFFTVTAMWALVQMGRRNAFWPVVPLGLALGLGALSHGLIIFGYVVPAAFLAPAWVGAEAARLSLGRWTLRVLLATALGLGLFAAWFVPLTQHLDLSAQLAQLQALLLPAPPSVLSVTMPWWGYLLMLPIILLPWSIWPLPWMRLWHVRQEKTDIGLVFCMTWALPMLLVLSLIEPRHVHYLLPLFPAYALALAYLLMDDDLADAGDDSIFSGMAFPVIVLGGLLAALPRLPRIEFLPDFLWQMPPLVGIVLAVVGIALAWLPQPRIHQRIINGAVISSLSMVFAILIAGLQIEPLLNQDKVLAQLVPLEQTQRPLAHLAPYQGEFDFAARLTHPVTVLQPDEVPAWAQHTPSGVLISRTSWLPGVPAQPIFEGGYIDGTLRMWDAATLVTQGDAGSAQ